LQTVFAHIGVAAVDGLVVTRENVTSRQPRWRWLHHRMTGNNAVRQWARDHLPLWVRDSITQPVGWLNLKPGRGPLLDPALRAELAVEFHQDIERLEAMTGRNLEHWKR
jgi:hypothetical protein